MALDQTAQKSNFWFSLKKYVIDNIAVINGIEVIFDKFLPPTSGVDRWLFVMQGVLGRDTVSEYTFEIYCVTRQDYEGDRLASLIDTVSGYFVGDVTKTDGLIRIPFYDALTQVQNGSMIIVDCKESGIGEAPDQSKFSILSITAKMASKV